MHHNRISNPENKNFFNISFIENPNHKSGDFNFDLQCPSVFRAYKINLDYEVSNLFILLVLSVIIMFFFFFFMKVMHNLFKLNVNGTIQDETKFKANIKLQPRNVYIDISHNSFGNNTVIFIQYLSPSPKSAEFQTKVFVSYFLSYLINQINIMTDIFIRFYGLDLKIKIILFLPEK